MTSRTKMPTPMRLAVAAGIVLSLATTSHGPGLAQSVASCNSWLVQGDNQATLDFWKTATASKVQRCLETGANLRAQTRLGSTVLHAAALAGNAKAVKALLAAGASVNARNELGDMPIHFAARMRAGNGEAVQVLLAAGANARAQSKDGVTPLHQAALTANVEAVRLLIAAGANVRAEVGKVTAPGDPILGPRGGETPLHWAIEQFAIGPIDRAQGELRKMGVDLGGPHI